MSDFLMTSTTVDISEEKSILTTVASLKYPLSEFQPLIRDIGMW